jgi:L-2,4-diaminobutyric acid acetyltransferase
MREQQSERDDSSSERRRSTMVRLYIQLVKRSPPLDLNSPYCYLLLCDHFSESLHTGPTSLTGGWLYLRIPSSGETDTLFVWQVA